MEFQITLGKKITKASLEKEGIRVSFFASDLLEKAKFSKKKEKVNLVVKTVAELGLPNGGTLNEIYTKAKEQGLKLCPTEVGPALRLAYKDQPSNNWLWVAMEPIPVRDGRPEVFYLSRYADGLWLGDGWAGPGSRWFPEYEFIFLLRKSSLKLKPFDSSETSDIYALNERVTKIENWIKKFNLE